MHRWKPEWRIRTLVAAVGLLASFAAGVPAGDAGPGTAVVTVTTASDEMNGDVSSVAALLANPGPDGVSLREAIVATNNDPGSETIGFAPSLAGATIAVGVGLPPGVGLPALTGGGVSIDGDISADGRPDVTVRNATAAAALA